MSLWVALPPAPWLMSMRGASNFGGRRVLLERVEDAALARSFLGAYLDLLEGLAAEVVVRSAGAFGETMSAPKGCSGVQAVPKTLHSGA